MFRLLAKRLVPSTRASCFLIPKLGVNSQPVSETVISVRELWKPALFACGFTGSAFAISAVYTHEKNRKAGRLRSYWERQRRNPGDGQKIAIAMAALNTVVFTCFRIKRLQNFMVKYFVLTASRGGPICLPMLLATFSHKDIIHLGINMFVLFSFAEPAVHILGREQFLAMYTSSAVFASLASLLHKVLTKSASASVGASGAILAIFAMHCLFFPDSTIQIVFLPFLAASAGKALPAVMCLDAAGMLFKWRILDHAAHFGGSCAGIFYYYQGRKLYQEYGSSIAKSWHKITSR